MDVTGYLEGAPELEAFVTLTGDDPRGDAEAERRLREAHVLVLGEPAPEGASEARLLHCSVPLADTTIEMVPVWTRVDHLLRALDMNPAWSTLTVFVVTGSVVFDDVAADEWIGINAWSAHEFKLPPAELRGPSGG